jgi:sirohydrochlorin ferrochelatase
VTTPLLLVAHGSRADAADTAVRELAGRVADRSGLDVHVGYVDVRGPTVADAVAALRGAVVVPAFLAEGHHVLRDLPAQLAAAGDDPTAFPVTAAPGTDPLLARAALARLDEAGRRPGDAVVLAAAGSADPRALAQVRHTARLLQGPVGGRVRVGFAASAAPPVDVLVARLRAAGERRIVLASWLLAPGLFQSRLEAAGADIVAAPLGAHDDVVAAVLRCYRSTTARAAA